MARTTRVLLLLVCLFAPFILAFSQTAPIPMRSGSPKDPAALLALARNQNGLEASGLQPWHIRVTYRTFDDAGQPKGTGVFEEWWAGPKQYKQSYTGKGFTQTDYVTDTGTYRTGEANFHH